MTAPPEQGKAAALFAGLLALAAGGAGLAVAGLVLGFDYLMRGEPFERQRLARQRHERRRSRYEDAAAWLDADRDDRARMRAARRAWFTADPATRGNAPAGEETLIRVLARAKHWAIVGGTRFARGWRDGREQARERRADGETGWWRPGQPDRSQTRPAGSPPDTNAPTDGPAAGQPAGEAPTPDIVDAEIVDDCGVAPPHDRDVVPVGEDQHPPHDDRLDEYDTRIDALRDEVDQTCGQRPNDVSPPIPRFRSR